jgi:ubiquinone/menaquinone biosynthesis C-methylase UbiE
MSAETPWQLVMFGRSLKKQQKLNALLEIAGNLTGQSCLLLTCGDNNGALNWYFREHGGAWTWGDVQDENLDEMRALLGEPVCHVPASAFPFREQAFDCVIAIDVLEHLPCDQPFLQEVWRVLKPSGRAIVTVPNGDPTLAANRLKWRMGMTPEIYGHTRAGYTIAELRAALQQAGFYPVAQGGYSRLFTEILELMLNFGYVFVLSGNKNRPKSGHIAPTTSRELKQHGLAYRLYSLAFPLLRLATRLDGFLSARGDGAVIVAAVRQEAAA